MREACERCDLVSDVWCCAPGSVSFCLLTSDQSLRSMTQSCVILSACAIRMRTPSDDDFYVTHTMVDPSGLAHMESITEALVLHSAVLLLPLAVSYCSHFHFSTHLKPTNIHNVQWPKNKTSRIFSGHKCHAWVSVCLSLSQLVFSGCMKSTWTFVHLYNYAFSRRFYPKRLTVHSGYNCFYQYMCSLGIEPTALALLTQCSTTEPQEYNLYCNEVTLSQMQMWLCCLIG